MYKTNPIVFVFPHSQPEGYRRRSLERSYREVCAAAYLRGIGLSAFVIRLTLSKNRHQQDDFDFAHEVDHRHGNDRFRHVSTALLKEVERVKPDLIVFKGLGYRLGPWLLAQSRHRFRFAFIVGGRTTDPLLPYADYVLAETPHQIDTSFRMHQCLGRAKVLPKLNLPMPVPPTVSKTFDIINVGSFVEQKNQKVLLPLASEYKLALIGDGPLYSSVEGLAHGCSNSVFMPGNVPRADVTSYIAQSRLMVHSAVMEGLPRVVMEAFACGVPVVALRSTLQGAFEHGVHGLLVEEHELLDAARALLEDPARLAEMGENARRYAEENCKEDTVFQVIEDMCETVRSGSASSPSNRLTRKRAFWILLRIDLIWHLKRVVRRVGLNRALRHPRRLRT